MAEEGEQEVEGVNPEGQTPNAPARTDRRGFLKTVGMWVAGTAAAAGFGHALGEALSKPEPLIEAGKKTGAEFKASGGNVPTGRRPGEVEVINKRIELGPDQPAKPAPAETQSPIITPTATPPPWERPFGAPDATTSTVQERAERYIREKNPK